MNKWVWAVIALVLIAGTVGVVMYLKKKSADEMTAMRYPVPASPMQEELLGREAAKWKRGNKALLDTLQAFEATPPPESDKPCPLALTIPREAEYESASVEEKVSSVPDPDEKRLALVHVDGDDLPARVAVQTKTLLTTAERRRFHSVRGRYFAVSALALPLVVVALEVNDKPGIKNEDTVIDGIHMGTHKAFVPGHRAGTAYIFDKETGKLRCAGRFEAFSSETVKTVQIKGEWSTSGNEDDAVELDFQNNTIKAIAESVRAI